MFFKDKAQHSKSHAVLKVFRSASNLNITVQRQIYANLENNLSFE